MSAAPEKPKNPFTQSIGPLEMMNYQRGTIEGEQIISPREINFSLDTLLNNGGNVFGERANDIAEGMNSPILAQSAVEENNNNNNNIFNLKIVTNHNKIDRLQQQIQSMQKDNALIKFFHLFNQKNESIANLFGLESKFEVINSILSSNISENII